MLLTCASCPPHRVSSPALGVHEDSSQMWRLNMLNSSLSLHLVHVKNRFSDLTKEQEGRDQQGKDVTQMIVKENLSERAVVKERRLGRVFPQERQRTPIGT